MGYVRRLVALFVLWRKYGRLSRNLKGLYKAIEREYKDYLSRHTREYTQRFKQQVWEKRLRRLLESYYSDRYPPSPLHVIEMRERTWRAMNVKKNAYIDCSIEKIEREDVL